MKSFAGRQRGISVVGMIMIAVGVVFAALSGMKLIPPYLHSAQISRIFKAIATDPEMQGASINDIQQSYAKRANMDYITDITAEDIEIEKGDGQLTLSASYSVRIPLAGNVTLLLEFNPSSS